MLLRMPNLRAPALASSAWTRWPTVLKCYWLLSFYLSFSSTGGYSLLRT